MKSPELIKRIIHGHTVVIGKLIFTTKHWGLGLPPELRKLIPEYISNNSNAQWAKDNSIDSVYVREILDDEFISEDKKYELLVDLADKEYVFWRLIDGF